MRILYVTTIGLTMGFFTNFIKELIDGGNTVEIAVNETDVSVPEVYRDWGCAVHQIDWSRTPFHPVNLRAIRQLRALVAKNRYDIVHCHTPVAGVCTRLACKGLRKDGVRVFYTTHGFHFYRGAPFVNWLFYYPIELLCSRFTDTLIAINREDYEIAQKRMKARRVEYVPGVGADVERFRDASADRAELRASLGIPSDAVVLLSVGELNANKNHAVVVRTLARMKNARLHYLIAGEGPQRERLSQLAKQLGVGEQVQLLGYRNDVPELCRAADIHVFSSIREGLGLAPIEAMAAGLPVLCSDNRGSREYVPRYDVPGCSCLFTDEASLAAGIERLISDPALYKLLSERGFPIAEQFSLEKVNAIMRRIYGLS